MGSWSPEKGGHGAANNTLVGPDGFRDIANFQYPAPLPGCVCTPGGAKVVAQNAFSVGCLALGPQSGSKMKTFGQVESRNGGSWCGHKHLSGARRLLGGHCKFPVPRAGAWVCVFREGVKSCCPKRIGPGVFGHWARKWIQNESIWAGGAPKREAMVRRTNHFRVQAGSWTL